MKKELLAARFISRINRFVALVDINGSETRVYVPNTGRMSELALPGSECLLAVSSGKYRYKILYLVSNGFPVMIDSTLSNGLFAELLISGKVPGFDHYSLVKREPVYGNHRFDYLLDDGQNNCYAELKSCTLFYCDVASFPDAISERASEHIRELALTQRGRLIILILNDSAEIFVPNYHTDYEFYLTLKQYSSSILISAFRIRYNAELEIDMLTPVNVHYPEASRSGFFFLVLVCNDAYNYVFLSEHCDDVFDSIRKLKNRKSSCGIICIESSMKILKDFPVAGDSYPDSNTAELFIENSGHELKKHNSPEGRLFRFDYNPMDRKWFHDHILKLRFSRYSILKSR